MKLHNKDIKIIKKLRKQGHSYERIARMFGVSHTTIRNYTKQKPNNFKRLTSYEVNTIKKIYATGAYSIRDIAYMFGCSYSTVYRKLS